MKKLKFFLGVALVATVLMVSCEKPINNATAIEIADNASLTQKVCADETQGSSSVSITTTGAWTSYITETTPLANAPARQKAPANAPDWVSISPDHGDAAGTYYIVIALDTNNTGEDRSAEITITCENQEVKISVSQLTVNTLQYDKGVVINGVKWATRNVDKQWYFTSKPEDYGMFYQWNSAIAWSTNDPLVNSNGTTTWNTSYSTSVKWESNNDPCPAGWRIPTYEEIQSLCDIEKVSSEWVNQNGVNGRKFIDKTTGAYIFIPAIGYRSSSDGILGYTDLGVYWGNTEYGGNGARSLYFSINEAKAGNHYGKASGLTIRPVAQD